MTSFQLFKGLTGIDSELLVSVEQKANTSEATQNKAQSNHLAGKKIWLIAAVIALTLLLVGCGAYIITRNLNWSKQLEKDLIPYNEDTAIGGVSKSWFIDKSTIELSAAPPMNGDVEITCNEWSPDTKGTLNIGTEYWIEKWNGKTYEEIPTLDASPWIVPEQKLICGTQSSWTVNYLEKYGSLEPGNYRIGMMVSKTSSDGESAQLGCFAKFRIQETSMAPYLEAYTKAFLALKDAEAYHIIFTEYSHDWNPISEFAESREEFWKSGNDWVTCYVIKELNADEFNHSGVGHMFRGGIGYGLNWTDGTVSDKPGDWSKLNFVDSRGCDSWCTIFSSAYQYAVDVQKSDDQINIIMSWVDGEYEELRVFYDSDGNIKRMEYSGIPNLIYSEEDRILYITIEILPTSEEQAAEVLKCIDVTNPSEFSFAEDLQQIESNGYVKKVDGFKNNTAQGKMNIESAARLAAAEISSKSNIVKVFYDHSAEIWKVEFTYSQDEDIYYAVYLDNEGVTQLITTKQ